MAGYTRRSSAAGSRQVNLSPKFRGLAASVLVALAPTIAKADWSGVEGPYTVKQSSSDITVTTHGNTVFSARSFTAAQYAKLLVEFELPSASNGASPSLHVKHSFGFVSLTGSLLAFKDEADIEVKGNAIPAGRTRFWTIDLKKGEHYGFGDDPLTLSPKSPGAFVDLRALYPEKAIAAAAVASDLERQAGLKAGEGLPDIMYDLAALGRKSPNCFLPGPDMTSSFALVGSQAALAKVDLGLQGLPNCRTQMTVLHLAMPRTAARGVSDAQVLAPAGLPPVIVEVGAPRTSEP